MLLRTIVKKCMRRFHQYSERFYCQQQQSSFIIKQTDHHLTSSDELPALQPGVLRLYSMNWCPFAQRTRLALAHKQIRHEIVNINLKQKPEWLFLKNPKGTVPVLELLQSNSQEAVLVCGSLECCDWLDKEYLDRPPLMTEYQQETIKRDAILQSIGKVAAVVNLLIHDVIPQESEELFFALADINLHVQSSTYLLGKTIGIMDFIFWPWMERLLAKGFCFDEKHDCAALEAWVSHMSNSPSVQLVRNSSAGYAVYWECQRAGKYTFDIIEPV